MLLVLQGQVPQRRPDLGLRLRVAGGHEQRAGVGDSLGLLLAPRPRVSRRHRTLSLAFRKVREREERVQPVQAITALQHRQPRRSAGAS